MSNKIDEIKKIAYEKLPELMPVRGNVMILDVKKNNGQILTSICFQPANSNCGPTVYAENYLKFKPQEAVIKMADVLGKHLIEGNVDVEKILEESNLRQNLTLRLVNKGRNQEMLEKLPYKTIWEDLAAYMVIEVDALDEENVAADVAGVVKVTNKLMNSGYINMSIDEMFDIAKENTKKQICIMDMCDIIEEKVGEEIPDDFMPRGMMSVISNKYQCYGAATVLGNLDMFGDDYYIIPSSVHEVIVLPNNGTIWELNQMVSDVNHSVVAPGDILSDHAYHVLNGTVIQDDMAAA